MTNVGINIRLLIAFIVLVAGTWLAESFLLRREPLEYDSTMRESVELTTKWFTMVGQMKAERGITSDAESNVANNYMIGDEWSEITTTLGSLESKETSTNPDFSALTVRLLHEAGIKKGDRVGVILSGSFPSLAISVLAALQTMQVDAVVMSSAGASTYGANQPGATWIDIEQLLVNKGGLLLSSSLVSMGAGEDAGFGLTEEGISIIKSSAENYNLELYIPSSLTESIEKRLSIFTEADISLLINIGGNQAALGNCPHSTTIPNGLNKWVGGCNDTDRGLIYRMNEAGIPFINMLDIKELASRYGIAVSPGISYNRSTNLYTQSSTNKPVIGFILAVSLLPLWFLKRESLNKEGGEIEKKNK